MPIKAFPEKVQSLVIKIYLGFDRKFTEKEKPGSSGSVV